jgi:hypothetical protein
MHAAPPERASGPRCASFERLAGRLASAASQAPPSACPTASAVLAADVFRQNRQGGKRPCRS